MKYIEGENHAKFTDKEIDKMPRKFRSLFKTRKLYAHVRKTEDDVYEVRRVHKGNIIMGTSKDLVKAKAKFIERLHQINFNTPPSNAKSNYLVEYMEEWLKIAKKPFIKENTFVNYQRAFSAYIKPHFQNKKLSECTYFEIQSYLNEFSNAGKHRTAKSIYPLLSSMFDYAVVDGILPRSPMAKIKLIRYEQKHGTPLTMEEELTFIQNFFANPDISYQAFVFILYTGIRRSELATATMDDGWYASPQPNNAKRWKKKSVPYPFPLCLLKCYRSLTFTK